MQIALNTIRLALLFAGLLLASAGFTGLIKKRPFVVRPRYFISSLVTGCVGVVLSRAVLELKSGSAVDAQWMVATIIACTAAVLFLKRIGPIVVVHIPKGYELFRLHGLAPSACRKDAAPSVGGNATVAKSDDFMRRSWWPGAVRITDPSVVDKAAATSLCTSLDSILGNMPSGTGLGFAALDAVVGVIAIAAAISSLLMGVLAA